MVKNLPAMQETWIQLLGWKDSLEKGIATHSVFSPGEFHGQRRLTQTVGHDRASNEQELLIYITTWMNLKNMPVERCQGQKYTFVKF